MIALVATLLGAVYILGPDLLARWVLGFSVPRKNLALTKSEEITRGIMWSVGPLILAWWLRHWGFYSFPAKARLDLQVFFSGLYSESYFNAHQSEFFAASASFLELNRCLLLRLYSIVLAGSIAVNLLIARYGQIREFLRGRRGLWSVVRQGLAIFVVPRISEWHLVLSPVLLPSQRMNIEVDVLTKTGTMYSGRLADKVMTASGELESLTLETPRRFRREQYLAAQKSDPEIKAERFWKPIPGNMFVILGSDISTLNIRHIPAVSRFGEKFGDIAQALREIERKLADLERGKA